MHTTAPSAKQYVPTEGHFSRTSDEALKRRAVHWLALSAALCAAGYMGLSVYGGLPEVARALGQVGIMGLASALALSVVNVLLRFLRWCMFLAVLGERLPILANLQIYLAGLGLIATPAKAGMAIRSVFLRRRGVSYPRSLAAFFAERFCDLTGLLAIAAAGVALHSTAPIALGTLTIVCLLFLLIVRRTEYMQVLRDRLLERGSRWSALFGHGADMLLEIGRCLRGRYFVAGIALGALANLAHALALYNMLAAFKANINAGQIAIIFALSTLAGSLSMLPGGLGGAEAAMLALLTLNGVERQLAVAAILFSRLTSLWFIALLGVLALLSLSWWRKEELATDGGQQHSPHSVDASRHA